MNNKYCSVIGFFAGIFFSALCFYLFNDKIGGESKKDNPYFILQSDYKIEGAGLLQKGTILKFDKGMDEGFNRFILYLNLKGGNIFKVDTLNSNSIVPYWLNEKS